MAYQTNGADLQQGSEKPYRSVKMSHIHNKLASVISKKLTLAFDF